MKCSKAFFKEKRLKGSGYFLIKEAELEEK